MWIKDVSDLFDEASGVIGFGFTESQLWEMGGSVGGANTVRHLSVRQIKFTLFL